MIFSTNIVFAVILAPAFFLLFRVYTRDNIARWVATGLVVILVFTIGFQLFEYKNTPPSTGDFSLPPGSAEAEIIQYQERSTLKTMGVLVWLVAAVVLLHIPPSNRWFR